MLKIETTHEIQLDAQELGSAVASANNYEQAAFFMVLEFYTRDYDWGIRCADIANIINAKVCDKEKVIKFLETLTHSLKGKE